MTHDPHRNPHYPPPQPPAYVVFTQPPQPRQSCLIHAFLAITTLGIGNVGYSVWHRHKYGR